MREQVREGMCDIFNFLNKANKKIILDNNKIIALEDICLEKNILHTAKCLTDLSSNL